MTAPHVEAALAAEADYLAECDAARRAESLRVYGHGGAHIPAAWPDPVVRVTRMLMAADAASEATP